MAGIYLHIPFCKQACVYCNFHYSTSLKLKPQILSAMLKEIKMESHYLNDENIETIYFGGGTPSLFSADEISILIDAIYNNFNVSNLLECTLEANPDDLNFKYLKSLQNTQVDRLSIGIQSFYDHNLLYMKRAHTAQQADYAIKAAQDAGFDNLSIDLIYGIPGLTDAEWKKNIQKVRDYAIPHFSAYALTVESKTALHYAITNKKSVPVDANQTANQFEILMEQAKEMGYDHYEISNFCIPGKHAIHNTNYWLGKKYLGIGPAAHSFNGHSRRWNIANNALYAKSILDDNKLLAETEELTVTNQINEYIMTSLRTMWGLDLDKIAKDWNSDAASTIEKSAKTFIERNWLQQTDKVIKLTHHGKLFADKIAAEMFI